MSARSRALIPLSAEQQAAMQAVAVTEQRRRQGRTLSAWPYATHSVPPYMPLARHKHMLVAVSERLYTLHKT